MVRANSSPLALALALLLLCASASPAQATWQLYATGDFGYSIANQKGSGSAEVGLAEPEQFSGSDSDVGPQIGGAIGLEVPMFEITPWRLPWDARLPDWPVRFEMEVSGLREYRPETSGLFEGTPNELRVNTTVKTWTFMNNLWFDVPLRGLYEPISATSSFIFREPRLPNVKRTLERLTIYGGVGIGFGHVDASVDDQFYSGKNDKYDFAYQFGSGFGFELTENINLGMSYRYIELAKLKVGIEDAGGREGRTSISGDIHEVRFQMRVRVFDLPYPWR